MQGDSLPVHAAHQTQHTPLILQATKRPRWGFIKTIVVISVLIYAVILILPLLLSFFYSFTNLNPLFPNTKFIGLQNYTNLLTDSDFRNALTKTISLSLSVTVIANVLGLGVALLLNRDTFFFAVLRTLFFIPQVLSGVIVAFIWSIILTTNNGILNILLSQLGIISKNIAWLGLPNLAFLSLTVVIIWQQMGFCAVIYLAALRGIPEDLYEAAIIDGARNWDKFQKITFPLLAPGVTTTVVLLLIITLKLYDQVAVLTAGGPGGATETLAYYIVRVTFTNNDAGYGSAMSLVLFVLIAISSVALTIYLRKREVEY